MVETFRKAPLVEIVAELHWPLSLASLPQPAVQPPQPVLVGTNQLEEFFVRFGLEVHNRDFHRAERLLPPGMLLPLGQAVVRFRRTTEQENVLYQVGPGMFSANATPPYRSWNDFAPVVESGVEALLAARTESEKEVPFTPVSLRYIDAFRSELTGGRNIVKFLAEVFEIELKLPSALTTRIPAGKYPNPYMIVAIPLERGTLRLTVGEAFIGPSTDPAVLFDTTFVGDEPVKPEKQCVMEAFGAAHSLIHELFMQLTKSIWDKMEPDGSAS